ncbi:CRTAC1 family protein [Microbulbifer spongiae]|uniref:CRTAC1 family protein n=1 Tax=Microbulbifer spongiae TaxID=2944933 RepID=A0ABY9EGT2_9GAMM|nr:CRTAC1 family protein [Microbulbifer sp. MI-G]WKD51542.1 CRTAC1 family protein [Microbulbifer sp. MI-G]
MKIRFSLICLIGLLSAHVSELYAGERNDKNIEEETIKPFREIGISLGFRGKHNTSIFSEGATLFDANNDGLLDLYLPHDGRPVYKATSKQGVLTNSNVPALPNTLFINQGVDSKGNPVLTPIQELVGKNRHYIREELLIENKYLPRKGIKDNEFSVGRIARAAVAADLNGDGLMDLYVLNAHYGMAVQNEETAMPFYPVETNLGREDRNSKEPLLFMAPPFLRVGMEDGLNVKVNFGDKEEWEGSNRLFINLGDKDHDGIPEWVDMTEKAGVGGRWDSQSATVADIDRDGDLDIYVSNFLDFDYFGFGMETFAGNRNQLYINQLVETGELTFIDKALEMKVAGLYEEEALPHGSYSLPLKKVISRAEQIVNGKKVGEEADHSWSAQLTDWNDDGWPDLVVANDVGGPRLRVYENNKGNTYRRDTQFDSPLWEGCWMGVESGDLDGDGHAELLATNCGSQVASIRNTALFVNSGKEMASMPRSQINYPLGQSTLHNILLSYTEDSGLKDVTLDTRVVHSEVIPPDMVNKNNVMPKHYDFYEEMRFKDGLSGLEFSWGPVMMDIDNDSDLDIYLAGALTRGNDGMGGDFSGGPGRLLVNSSSPGNFKFHDKTFEYRLMDIDYMDYDHEPPRRKAPGTGWHKRDYIYINDIDSFSEMGLEAAKKGEIRDIFRMHEAAVGMISGDLNDDGFADLVVTHASGYNSLSPEARNLKVSFNGQVMALPGTDKLRHPPTNFESGKTFVYINGGVVEADIANWVKIRLIDSESPNIFGVGAKVVVNNTIVRRINIGGPSFSSYSGDLLVGLGKESVEKLQVRWPSGADKLDSYMLQKPVKNDLICLYRGKGVMPCDLVGESIAASKFAVKNSNPETD